ncbi:SBBP repeat-containing protein [Vitiosangium sp. GDMCC 1.1324]|uniref:SBBP repeat-containing protein n=1 Tax=Vitiosangium sp. (strain GDMCC 1.1324) TaxID=2138576 RepID=UPI00130D946B|nr:SBBP repeat-containing protein [Vitiosangium sp. GDMCC 1.1324]
MSSRAAEHTQPPAWSRQLGTSAYEQASAVAAARGEVYVAGYTGGQVGADPAKGGYDGFVMKLGVDGSPTWTRQYGSPNNEYVTGLAVDDRDPKSVAIYVAGYTTGGLDGQTSAGGSDLFLVKYDAAGTRLWTRQLGTGLGDFAQGVATAPDGSVYVTGYTSGGLDGNTNAGGQDLFLVKYDAAGSRQWTRQLGSASNDQARGVAVGADGAVYVTGFTSGGLDGNTNAGGQDLFLAKYDVAGTRQWTRQLGTNGLDVAQAVATSRRSSGETEIYVVGRTRGSTTGTGLDGRAQLGDYDIVVLKYDAAGTRVWTRQDGTVGEDSASGVASDGGGNVYVTGSVPLDLMSGAALGSNDLVLLKYDAAGARLGVRQLGSVNDANPSLRSDWGLGVAADRERGVYVAGYTEGGLGTSTGGAGDKDAVVVKYLDGCEVNAPGACALGYGWGKVTPPPASWARQLGASGDQYAYGLVHSPLGGLYATGVTQDGLDGNTSAGGSDLFLVRYDTQGARQWTRQLGTSQEELAYAIANDTGGNLYVAGATAGSLGGSNAGDYDVLLVKFDAEGRVKWIRQFGSLDFELATAVAVAPDGSVYVAGFTYGNLDGNTNAGELTGDAFVTRYDPEGNRLWTRLLGTNMHDQAEAITVGADGTLYVAGTTEGSMDGVTQQGDADAFVVALTGEGKVLWRSQFGSAGYDYAVGVAVDEVGRVYVAGGVGASFDGNPQLGQEDLFLTRRSPSGAREWSRTYGSAESDFAGGLARDAAGNLYLTGSTLGALGATSFGGQDVVLLKLDAEGLPLWTRQSGTDQDEHAEAVCVDDSGAPYTAGGTLGAFEGQRNAGGYDILLQKHAP